MASSERTHSRAELAFWSLLAILTLPGCPVSDDYFVDPTLGADGARAGSPATGGAGGSGGDAGKGGKDGNPTGGSAGSEPTGGSAGSEPTGGTGGGSGGSAGGGGPSDGWVTISTPPGGFSPREKAAYTSIGSQLFIWGGVNESGTALNSGALYDPRTDSWVVVASDANTPSPRSLATAVWTGSVIVVWGGLDPVTMEPLADGAIYDPVADAWLPMSAGPRARSAAVGAYVDERVVFFGGQDGSANPLGGLDHYESIMDAWRSSGMLGGPPPVADPAAAGGEFTFWTYGGRTMMNAGTTAANYYSMMSDRWVAVDPRTPGRWGSFAAFAGTAFFVWGGRNLNDFFDNGASHGVSLMSRWEPMSTTLAPSARFTVARESGWTFVIDVETNARIVIIAGLDAPSSYLTDGAIYDVDNDAWEAIPVWPSPASHAFGAAGFAAGELIVWGGREGETLTNQGVRYLPPN